MPYKDKEKQADFIRRSSRAITVRFVNSTDKEVIDWLDNQEHPSTEIKKIIKDHIKKGE